MTGVVRRIEGHEQSELEQGWEMTSTAAGAARTPAELEALATALTWIAARAPATAAAILRDARRFELGGAVRRFDAEDFWFRMRIPAFALGEAERLFLCFDGLATLAEVWLDGAPILTSDNMFVAHALDITSGAAHERPLLIRFAALESVLRARKPRPRWRTPMLEHQQLRFIRTTLLGRTPGWSPPVAPVGPWRPVRLERRRGVEVTDVQVRTSLEHDEGRVRVQLTLRPLDGVARRAAKLSITGPGTALEFPAEAGELRDGLQTLQLEVSVPDAQRWWPHTHGAQPLYTLALLVTAGPVDGSDICIELGSVGFRTLSLRVDDGDFQLSINGEPVFMRGACWTPLDVVSLGGTPQAYRAALEAVRDAGMNMLRVVGSMTYELPVFYDLCDELGIALWHDLMFANMDYPEDPAFVRVVCVEVGQVLATWQGRPSIALVCGDSEGAQQAAMWGSPRATWQRPLFEQTLRALCDAALPGVPYWPSSSSGSGAYPHQPNAGPTSYYGVGAYLRPLEDARRSAVRFGSECLAFANIPEPALLEALAGDRTLHAHSPRWKERSPRDLGAGWDFDDVRDHYLRVLFGHDPTQLRYADHERYLALGRVTSGEVMAAAFGEWRRRRSSCRGALVWFLRDLWPGAGWGLIDSLGAPKAAFYALRRVLQPLGLCFSDEGLSGLYVHVFNEAPSARELELRLQLFRHHEQRIFDVRVPLTLGPRANLELAVAAHLPGFVDVTRAFRFGPPAVDLVVGELLDASGSCLGDAFFFPLGLPTHQEGDLGLSAIARALPGGDYELHVEARSFAQSVAVECARHRPSDSYFHLAPGQRRTLRLIAMGNDAGPPRGQLHALNARAPVSISTASQGS